MNPFAELAEVAATFAALYAIALLAARRHQASPPAEPVPARETPTWAGGPVTFGYDDELDEGENQ